MVSAFFVKKSRYQMYSRVHFIQSEQNHAGTFMHSGLNQSL